MREREDGNLFSRDCRPPTTVVKSLCSCWGFIPKTLFLYEKNTLDLADSYFHASNVAACGEHCH